MNYLHCISALVPVVLWKWNYKSKIGVGGREGTLSLLPVSRGQRVLGKQRFFFSSGSRHERAGRKPNDILAKKGKGAFSVIENGRKDKLSSGQEKKMVFHF